MDLITVIDKYIEISIRRDNLNKTIESEKDGYAYAKIEGDMAFSEGDYERESGYNTSAIMHKERQASAEKELEQVAQLLEFTHQTYISAVSSMDSIQLKEAAITMSVRKKDIERQIEELSQRREWARLQGDKAFASHNFQEEQEYNKISSECYFEINKVEPKIRYYQSFANDLDFRADKVNENNFGGPKL